MCDQWGTCRAKPEKYRDKYSDDRLWTEKCDVRLWTEEWDVGSWTASAGDADAGGGARTGEAGTLYSGTAQEYAGIAKFEQIKTNQNILQPYFKIYIVYIFTKISDNILPTSWSHNK